MINIKKIKDNIKIFYIRWIVGPPGAFIDKRRVTYRLAGISLVVVFFCYELIWWYNTDMKELNKLAESVSQVKKEFQRKENLVQNLTNVVNNYALHERVLFQHVSDMRALLQSLETFEGAPSTSQNTKIEQAFLRLSALAEQYPDLKAEKCFQELMDMEETTENRVADTLDEYAEVVREFCACNQRLWCNYFTYPIAGFVPLPAYWEYYHTDSDYTTTIPAEILVAAERSSVDTINLKN